jgi:Fe-S-cluster-containing hydrogenase component 2
MIYIQSKQCVGCGDCLDACPVGAIQLTDGYAVIDQDKCQQCEICLPICPQHAIVAVMDQPPTSDTLAHVPMKVQPAPVQEIHPTNRIAPWFVAALAFVGREIVPRVVASLLEVWDRRMQQPTTISDVASSDSPNGYTTLVAAGHNRGRQRRQRRHGQW